MRMQSGYSIQIEHIIAFLKIYKYITTCLVSLVINLPNRNNYHTSQQVLKILHARNKWHRAEVSPFNMAENRTRYLRLEWYVQILIGNGWEYCFTMRIQVWRKPTALGLHHHHHVPFTWKGKWRKYDAVLSCNITSWQLDMWRTNSFLSLKQRFNHFCNIL